MFIVFFPLSRVQPHGCLQKSQNQFLFIFDRIWWFVVLCIQTTSWFLGGPRQTAFQKARKVMTLLQELSFTINIKKSMLGPTQQIQFLGLILDLIQMKVFLPKPKVLDLIESYQAILSMTSLTARSLASLQGKISSCLYAVLPAPTFYRAIQADIHQAISKTNNFSKKLICRQRPNQKYGGG